MFRPFLPDVASPINPGQAIVVKNMKPKSWSGLPTNFGLYKSDKLLMTQQSVGVGSKAVFQLTPNLYFGVIKDIKYSTVFSSLSIMQKYFCVDLNNFANGLIVNLTRNVASGEYIFKAKQAQPL